MSCVYTSLTLWRSCRCVATVLLLLMQQQLSLAVDENEGELGIEVIEKPDDCSKTSASGNALKVHYQGYLSDGTIFDSSRERNNPMTFLLGQNRVIKGWDLGLLDMCVGEKRRLTIPPRYGYGKKGFGTIIGPDEVLIFEVELLDIQEVEQRDDLESYRFEDLDLDNDGLLSRDEVKQYLWKMSKRLEEISMQMETKEGRMALINKIMNIHDKNKDGFLDEDEYYMPTDSPGDPDHQEL